MTDQTDNFLDLPAALREAARVHGRAMVALVYDSGMATEAVKVLAATGGAREAVALRVLVDVFNQTSTALAKARGWTSAELNECEQLIEVGFAQQRRLVGVDGKALGD